MEGKKIPPTVPVKVMSFNIAHGLGMDGEVNLENTARIIEESEAEIIGLQELDRYFTERSSFMDQVDWLSNRLGMYAAYGANINLEPIEAERPNRQYGNAVLSKYPIKYIENHLLTQVSSPLVHDEQRGLLETIIEVRGTYLSFFNTHLALKDEELRVSIDEIFAIASRSRFPKIITGDFNAPPTHPEINRMSGRFTDVFAQMNQGEAYTYPSVYDNLETGEEYRPVTRIDYIFTDQHMAVESAAAIATGVSDHLPITAELVLARIALPVMQAVQLSKA